MADVKERADVVEVVEQQERLGGNAEALQRRWFLKTAFGETSRRSGYESQKTRNL